MGSGDLNMKKSWHPQRSGNVAATQKAEAEAIAERKKMQQRLQEIEEERRKEEIQKTLEAAGGKRKVDRVEWMYAGPTDGQGGDSAEKEAYLLGKRRIDKLLQDNEVKKLSKQATEDNVTAVPTISNARDIATKIREDPLLAIKRQEQQAYEAMMNDPIKRRQLLASMGLDDPHQKSKRREEKRDRNRHHHRSHRSHKDDHDAGDDRRSRRRRSDSRDGSRSPRRNRSRDGRRDKSRSPRRNYSRSPRRDRSRSPRRHDDDDRRRSRRDSPVRKRQRSESAHDRYGRNRRGGDRREDTPPRRPNSTREDGSRSPSPKRSVNRPVEYLDRSRHSDDDRNGQRDRRHHQPRRDYGRDDRPSQVPKAPKNAVVGQEEIDRERARKLAAMQEAATDLDLDRERRLAAIEAAEKAQKEADDLTRQRNKKFGGDAGFTNSLHSRAADMKIADRVRAR
ncbi:hypothetical protein OQA88_4745 [Cercophora sp. LCS_1]